MQGRRKTGRDAKKKRKREREERRGEATAIPDFHFN